MTYIQWETNLMDADGTIGMAGLFIPEQWSMPLILTSLVIHL